MNLLEKIFQRNDKFFLLVYYFILGLSLWAISPLAYYIRNKNWDFPEIYNEGSILISLIFVSLTVFKSSESRFIKGAVQWFKVEFTILIQTFIIVVLLTVMFKNTDNYSRIWFFLYLGSSVTSFLLLKVLFDFLYTGLIKSNSIQRNILLIGDTENCQNIIKNFPRKIRNSVIKCLIIIDQAEKKDLNYYGVPAFNLNDDYNHILNHHTIGQIWIVSSSKTQSYIEGLIDKFLNFSIDCRLILPESKFKFIEGLDSEAGFDFYNISFSPFHGTSFLLKNIFDKVLSLIFLIISLPIIILFSIFILI